VLKTSEILYGPAECTIPDLPGEIYGNNLIITAQIMSSTVVDGKTANASFTTSKIRPGIITVI